MIGIVCGLKSEARTLAHLPADRFRVCVSGANALRAHEQAKGLARDGARMLISFGLAGGLAVDLRPGDLLLNGRVHLPDGGEIHADSALLAALSQLLQPVRLAAAAGADQAVLSPIGKARLASGGGECVDMETHGVARAASEAGRPWAAVRAIADDARTALPKWAMGLMREDGSVDDAKAALALLRAPWDLPLALRLADANAKALAALRRAADALLGLPELLPAANAGF